MNQPSHPGHGKITIHGNGLGAPSPDMVERRAREIAMIDGRNPDEFSDADWTQARRELMGEESHTAPEEVEERMEAAEWDGIAGTPGHRAPRSGPEDGEESVGEQLVTDGLDEAAHDQMLEARREQNEEDAG